MSTQFSKETFSILKNLISDNKELEAIEILKGLNPSEYDEALIILKSNLTELEETS